MNRIAQKVLINFAIYLKGLIKDNFVTSLHLETTKYTHLSESHSFIVGALCHSAYKVVRGEYVLAIGHGLKADLRGKRRFTPDISLWKVNDAKKLVGIIDYESTNSSDSRVFRRDFENYREYIQTPLFSTPEFWIIITTLPSKKVSKSNWYSWDLRRKRISRNEYLRMIEDPFKYWFSHYEDKFNRLVEQRRKCPLYVVNLDATELRLCLPKDEQFFITLGTNKGAFKSITVPNSGRLGYSD
jgi:hypothetical protein